MKQRPATRCTHYIAKLESGCSAITASSTVPILPHSAVNRQPVTRFRNICTNSAASSQKYNFSGCQNRNTGKLDGMCVLLAADAGGCRG